MAEADAAGEAGETSRLLGDDAFLCKLCGCSVAAAAAKTHLGGAKHALRVQMLMAMAEATPPKKGRTREPEPEPSEPSEPGEPGEPSEPGEPGWP